MTSAFYKLRRNKVISGVLAGLADKFGWDLSLVRILVAIGAYFSTFFAIFLYILLAVVLPYKEDVMADKFGTGPRKLKQAKPAKEDNDDWFW